MKYRNLNKVTHFILIILLFLFISEIKTIDNHRLDQKNILEQIQYLYYKLNSQSYWNKNQQFQSFRQWEHMKGIYQSKVHFNYLDKKNTLFADKLRNDLFKIDDINMFVSSFVLYGLQQASNLGTHIFISNIGTLKLDQHKFSQTIQAITQFRDKNTPLGIPSYSFWPQQLINGTWSAHSVNLLNLINMVPDFSPRMAKFLNKHGLGFLTIIKNMSVAFAIPPDNDDSGVNLALLGLLKQSNSSHYEYFNSFNYNKLGFYQKVLKYAYRPFDQDYPQNKRAHEIDPRTYFVLHPFLTQIKQDAEYYNTTASLILPTTWLVNMDTQVDTRIVMPFQTNNVDATVSTNFLFGLTYQVLTQQIKVQDLHEDLIQMMHDTVKLIQFVIQQIDNVNSQGKQQGRLDLILVYYPSKYDFYWFVSRTIHLLRKYEKTKLEQEQYTDFKEIYVKLSEIMKNKGTQNILKSKIMVKNNKGLDGSLWQQFLGNYANKHRNDDAMFATSLAINALIDTWSIRDHNKLTYDLNTPKQVKQSVDQAVKYLRWYINKQMTSKTGYKMKLQNVFFSGSMKIFKTSFPYFYPANVHYDKSGKDFDPTNMDVRDLQFGSKYFMRGYIEDDEYQHMLSKKWFKSDVPVNFTGYNDGKGLTFPYWSSKAISQVMIINALSKYIKVNQNNNIINESNRQQIIYADQ